MAALVQAQPAVIDSLQQKLQTASTSLQEKYRVLFSLRNVKGEQAHSAILLALRDPSALFRHEVAYCLGQRQDPAAIRVLTQILHDTKEHPMVRHEAGEALGAIGTPECLEPLEQHQQDPVQEVAETCQLALQRIQFFNENPAYHDTESPFYSVDPTPAFPAVTPVSELRTVILNDKAPMFQRYRALFALRNRGGPEAVQVLGEVFRCSSALLKHEVAYVMGQMLNGAAVDVLTQVLQRSDEAAMVRHEAAEALGAIAEPRCLELLQQYSHDPEPIVADSCIVALDMLEFEASGELEYADTGKQAKCCC